MSRPSWVGFTDSSIGRWRVAPVDDRVVVRGHLVRLGEGDEVLPEAREEDPLPCGSRAAAAKAAPRPRRA